MRPLAITSDIHSCFPEFVALLEGLGFKIVKGEIQGPPDQRLLVFAGDLVDRGDYAALTLLLMDRLVREGHAEIGALGNHDERLFDSLTGHGFGDKVITSAVDTLRQLLIFENPKLPRDAALRLFGNAPRFSVFHKERLVVTHGAALPTDLHPRADPHAFHFTRGVLAKKLDSRGRRPRTYDWVKKWRSHSYHVVFGHHPTPSRLPGFLAGGAAIAIDTGCAMGGNLSAILYPEKSFLIVKSSIKIEGDGPRGIQVSMKPPAATSIKRARVTLARTERWEKLVLEGVGLKKEKKAEGKTPTSPVPSIVKTTKSHALSLFED